MSTISGIVGSKFKVQSADPLVGLPLLVDVKIGEVVTLGNLELFSCLITLLLPTLGTVEDSWHRQHGDNDLEHRKGERRRQGERRRKGERRRNGRGER